MHISKDGLDLIKHFESCKERTKDGRFKAYYCPANKLTIGWGHTNDHGTKFNAGSVWTQAECDAELASDMQIFEAVVKKWVKVPLEQYQFDACVSFSYNVGEGDPKNKENPGFAGSTLLRKINAKDFEGAAREFQKWNKSRGQVLRGLSRRRASEACMFQGLVDKDFDGNPDSMMHVPQAEPMPQQVDAPVVKPESESTINTGAKVGGGLGITAIISLVLEKIGDASKSTLDFLMTLAQKPYFWIAIATIGAFFYIDWRRKVMRRDEGV